MRQTFSKLLALAALLCTSVGHAWSTTHAPSNGLTPFHIEYQVVFRGANAGISELQLEKVNGEQWRYRSSNQARGIFRLAFPGEIRQTSLLRIDQGRVQPLRFDADDGTDNKKRDVRLVFDWSRLLATGIAEEKPVEVSILPGVQDAMSVQVALIAALQRGEQPSSFTLLDRRELKDYLYQEVGRERLNTSQGSFDTVIWSSQRVGSSRVTRVWYAPALGHLPIKAQRLRDGREEWSMTLRSLKSSAK